MVDHIDDSSQRRYRVDLRTGVGRRRRWSAEEKGRIVAESYAPGAVASEVARRHEITSQHLFAWRKAARQGRLVLPGNPSPPSGWIEDFHLQAVVHARHTKIGLPEREPRAHQWSAEVLAALALGDRDITLRTRRRDQRMQGFNVGRKVICDLAHGRY